jgi:hypothetical protein
MVFEAIGVLLVGALIGLWLSRRQRKRGATPGLFSPIVVVSFGIAHLIAYYMLFSTAFALGDAGMEAPWYLGGALAVLQTPLMYVLYLDPSYFGDRWWGDDSNLMRGLSLLNAFLWGLSAAWLIGRWRRRSAA